MIYVRDDDVLIPGKGGLERFRRYHELICSNPRFLHRAAILVTEIQTVPGAVEYVYDEWDKGRLFLELHGLEHVDYGAMPKHKVIDHLHKALEWMRPACPGRWYTPWGSTQPHLHEAAKEVGLELVDCSNIIKLRGRNGAVDILREGRDLDYFENKELFTHYWEKGNRLQRIVNFEQYGSWKAVTEVFGMGGEQV